MNTIKTFSDGGRTVEVAGMKITAGRNGVVCWMSDWSRCLELVAAGVLTRNVWKGSGMYGHDTYTLRG
jgi:hypothetical protein